MQSSFPANASVSQDAYLIHLVKSDNVVKTTCTLCLLITSARNADAHSILRYNIKNIIQVNYGRPARIPTPDFKIPLQQRPIRPIGFKNHAVQEDVFNLDFIDVITLFEKICFLFNFIFDDNLRFGAEINAH